MKKIGTHRGVKPKAAEGETDVASVWTPRRLNFGIKVEVVTTCASRTPDSISHTRRPVLTIDASVPESTRSVGRIYVTAAHKGTELDSGDIPRSGKAAKLL